MRVTVHPSVTQQLDGIQSTTTGTILIHGAAHAGKRTVARDVARARACEGCSDESCRGCRMALHGNHPNIITIEPDEKGKIGVEAVHDLQHQLRYAQYDPKSQRSVIVIGADTLTLPAQNALLKTLEEPPAGTMMILTANQPTALLPTVLSRCTAIFLPPLSEATIQDTLVDHASMSSLQAKTIAQRSRGALGQALRYAKEPELFEKDKEITARLDRLMTARQLMERLQIAAEIASKTDEQAQYVDELTYLARQQARSSEDVSDRQLEAIQKLRQHLAANVSPKSAFEAVALELA